jgi:hypothetical protein
VAIAETPQKIDSEQAAPAAIAKAEKRRTVMGKIKLVQLHHEERSILFVWNIAIENFLLLFIEWLTKDVFEGEQRNVNGVVEMTLNFEFKELPDIDQYPCSNSDHFARGGNRNFLDGRTHCLQTLYKSELDLTDSVGYLAPMGVSVVFR